MGQQLAAVAMMAQMFAKGAAGRDQALATQAARIADGVEEVLHSAKRLARGLAPLGIADQGLVPALRHLGKQLAEAAGVCCEVQPEPEVEVTNPRNAMHLYRIAQEAANNALRHGKATQIVFSLIRHEGGIELSIHDNGKGLNQNPSSHQGLGLRTMQHRAKILGGRLVFESSASRGTSVRCWIPESV